MAGREAGAGPGFSWPVRVYWEDTDGGGIVYHASYLKFLERARTEWLRDRGWSQAQLAADAGVVFTVASLTIDYRRPARLDDALTVVCAAAHIGAASLIFEQQILRAAPPGEVCPQGQEDLLARARVKVACVDARTLKPQRLPAELAAALGGPQGAREGSRQA